MKYQQFIFENYAFDSSTKTLELTYSYDDILYFTETYKFDFNFVEYDSEQLDRAFQLLFYVAGVSYYKAYLAPEIVVKHGLIDPKIATYLNNTYQKGLGEFFYLNKLDPQTKINFPINSIPLSPIQNLNNQGLLIGLGGGKDSLLSVELLRDQPKVATWSLNHHSQLEPLVNAVGLNHFWVSRDWDQQLIKLNTEDALNGHVPISAIISCVGTIVAILAGYSDSIVSNESSASEPSLKYQGTDINHQYSKSLDYESEFQTVLAHLFGEGLKYYSLLRPYTELRIAELFSKIGFDKYKSIFSSCNRAFTHDQKHMFWCGECPKCAFVFLIFTPFVDRYVLEALFKGKNLLLDTGLTDIYLNLLGIDGEKPLDCVGEIKESRVAMRLAQESYPELAKYHFDIPKDYDFRAESQHLMPLSIYELISAKLINY